MYLMTRIVIKDNAQITIRVKALNWNGSRYGLVVNGEVIKIGSYETIIEAYETF